MTTKQIPNNGIFPAIKRPGETPLECLNRLRIEYPELKDETLSYAGRLDPLASGLLLVLVGDEANRNREDYLGLDKTYEIDVLFGVSTDTYDVLGVVKETKEYEREKLQKDILQHIKNVSSFMNMKYPPYSSKPVSGKPLFQWAREGKLSEIDIPTQEGKIKEINFLTFVTYTPEDLQNKIQNMIKGVSGDFRQEEILKNWEGKLINKEYLVVKVSIDCESGVYMRSFANLFGELVGVPALALNILRTKVGTFDLDQI